MPTKRPDSSSVVSTSAAAAIDVSGAEKLLLDARGQLQQHVPSSSAVEFWRGQISDERAYADGRRVSSERVLADAMTEFPIVLPILLEQPLPGYGPRRLHYGISLALELDSSYRVYRIVETGKASASQGKDDALAAARKKRDTLEHVLGSLVKGNSTRLAAFNKARGYDAKKPTQLAASIETFADIAQEMLAGAAKNATLREVYADAGLNPSLEQTARAEAQRLVGAKGAHGQKSTEEATNSDALNTLDGRLWFELLALKHAAAEARSEGRKVPEIKLEQLDRRRKDKKPAVAPSTSNGVTAAAQP